MILVKNLTLFFPSPFGKKKNKQNKKQPAKCVWWYSRKKKVFLDFIKNQKVKKVGESGFFQRG